MDGDERVLLLYAVDGEGEGEEVEAACLVAALWLMLASHVVLVEGTIRPIRLRKLMGRLRGAVSPAERGVAGHGRRDAGMIADRVRGSAGHHSRRAAHRLATFDAIG